MVISEYSVFMILKLLLISIMSLGSIPKPQPLRVGFDKKNRYFNRGHFLGGQYKKDNVLTDFRRKFYSQKNIERLIFENQTRRFSFFHVTKNSPSSLFLNMGLKLPQNMSHDELEQRMVKSPLVERVEITSDPFDGNLNVVLSLQKGVVFEVFEMVQSNKYGRLVLDLMLRK